MICLVLSIRYLIYNRKLNALGGIHAPKILNGPVAGNFRVL